MQLKKILLVNDDTGDLIRIKQRLPKNLDISIATQNQARWLGNYNYDLIVIDNDANDLKKAKGPETLAEIRKKGVKVKIFFTSFQPGWVDKKVYKTRGVQVVKTDRLLLVLKKEFNLKLRPIRRQSKIKPETTLIISYNPVNGYKEGIYCNGKLIILSYDKYAEEMAPKILQEKLQKIYQDFEWRSDRDRIKNIFVYDGLNGREWPARLAVLLGHDIRMKVQLVACPCEWERKVKTANSMYINLYQVNHGGSDELGVIADIVLGIKRPNVNYSEIPIPLNIIKRGAEKFKI